MFFSTVWRKSEQSAEDVVSDGSRREFLIRCASVVAAAGGLLSLRSGDGGPGAYGESAYGDE